MRNNLSGLIQFAADDAQKASFNGSVYRKQLAKYGEWVNPEYPYLSSDPIMTLDETFSSGDLIAELFLPGTLLTDTPDDTVTLATTTGVWLPFSLSAYNAGTDPRYATIRITAKTATAGAYAFLADPYDADRLSLWDEGHVSPVLAASDFSAIPELTRLAVWSDTDTYNDGEKGQVLQDASDNAELGAVT